MMLMTSVLFSYKHAWQLPQNYMRVYDNLFVYMRRHYIYIYIHRSISSKHQSTFYHIIYVYTHTENAIIPFVFVSACCVWYNPWFRPSKWTCEHLPWNFPHPGNPVLFLHQWRTIVAWHWNLSAQRFSHQRLLWELLWSTVCHLLQLFDMSEFQA